MVTVSLRMPARLRDEMAERGDSLTGSILAACEAAVRPVATLPNDGNRPRTSNPTRVIASRGPTRGINLGDMSPSRDCRHPVTRRIGDYCAGCGATISKGSAR